MAGKSNKNKNKGKASATSAENASGGVDDFTASDNSMSNEAGNNESAMVDTSDVEDVKDSTALTGSESVSGGNVEKSNVANGDIKDAAAPLSETESHSDGELRLYPMAVKGPSGEKLDLQVNPVDSVIELRQFLLDAPETCFYTCYDLILIAPDGTRHQLADFYEIGDVADVTSGRCSLEMVNALYDDRSVRTHLRRTRDLLCTTSFHSSFSTALAMENESKKQTVGGIAKSEAPELEGLGFMEDSMGQLGNLVTAPSSQEIKCVESIAFSSFNPVPGFRRLLGDLIYLDIHTLEGKNFCVTAHTKGFFVNASSGNILDPRMSNSSRQATTLVGLLRQLSEKFSKGFSDVLERKAQGHPFENVPGLLPLNPWLGPYPPPSHKRDVARAEDALMLPYGTETIGMQRDWNEELQSCREFPRKTLQDRIMRDRALYKVNCDFVDAAVKGAKGVIGRCIPPINPTDPERFHMYVHNNIFFSFAVDGDFTLMQQMHEEGAKPTESNGNDQPVSELEPKSVLEAGSIEQSVENRAQEPVEGDKDACDATVSERSSFDNKPDQPNECSKGGEDSTIDESASLQVVESEQATYASANNDLKGTKAYNNADITGLYTLAMAIVDYRGHRIVAQSIIPGILQGDKSDSLLYGSVDNGKKIFWNDKFHEKVLEASKLLHVKEHEVVDGSGNVVRMAAPVECKGIVGSDDRHYILDLMRTTPRDSNYTGPGSRHAVLRPELVAAFCQTEALARVKGKVDEKEEGDHKSLLQEELLSICLNPNVLTDFKLAGDPQEIAADEEAVRRAGKYLIDVVLPKFVQDLNSLEVSPMDGQTLTEALHAHGINMRYLGKVASLSKKLPHIWDLCVLEMVTRTAKHVLKGILRETQDHDVGGAIAHFLNCYIGQDTGAGSGEQLEKAVEDSNTKASAKAGSSEKSRKKSKGHGKKAAESPDIKLGGGKDDASRPSYLCITSDLVWKDIHDGIKFKYQFDLPDDVKAKVRRISTIRNLCQKVGVTIAARSYDLSKAAPFQTSDILDLHSVVKHSAPMCADARDLLESGKLRLAEAKLNEAYELFTEGFSILQQVCGPMHREVANCCRYLAMVLYHAGDMAGAIMQQHKELIINERCLGLDHPDTAHSYGNMALFYHGLNQTELALRHMARTLLLLNVSSGPDHPDVAATFINIAMMYQDIGKMNVALRYLQEALQKNLRLLGEDHIQTAVCYHALAIAFNCIGAFKLSLQHERSTYNILAKQLGEEDTRTRDSANWLKTFQTREMEKGQQAVNLAAAQKAADVLKARPDLLQAFQAAAGGGGVSRGALNKAAAAAALIGERETLPRSRGMDERGARAAAEVRKRAAAKSRSQGSSSQAQSIPSGLELLALINNVATNKASADQVATSRPSKGSEIDAQEPTVSSETKASDETSGVSSSETVAVNNGVLETTSESDPKEQTPEGLGTGLGARKLKQKAKTPSVSQ